MEKSHKAVNKTVLNLAFPQIQNSAECRTIVQTKTLLQTRSANFTSHLTDTANI